MNKEATGFLDILKENSNTVTVCGWGAYKEGEGYIPPDFFVIKSNGEIIEKIKPNHHRGDVCKYLNEDDNLIYGFSIDIPKNKFLIYDGDVDRCINISMQLDNIHVYNLSAQCFENIKQSDKIKDAGFPNKIELGFNALYNISIENIGGNLIRIFGTCKFENSDLTYSYPVNYLLIYEDSIHSCYKNNIDKLDAFNICIDVHEFNNDLKNVYLLAKHPDGYYCELYTKYNSIHYSPLFDFKKSINHISNNFCPRINNDMVFYPNQIEVCCNIGHGIDVVTPTLLDNFSERPFKKFKNSIDYKQFMAIITQRRKLFDNALSKGRIRKCFGCNQIKKSKHNQKIYMPDIRLTQSTVCNLRCVYCSMKINERQGKIENYNFAELLYQMFKNKDLDTMARIFWQGGEPTIQKNFINNITRFSSETVTPQIIVSNSVHFIPELIPLLKMNKIIILTSIDAGCVETYKKIRGKDRFNSVIDNISKYAKCSKNIICQYILLKENNSKHEIFMFLDLMKTIGIKHVSCTFNIFDSQEEHSEYIESYNYFIETAKLLDLNPVMDVLGLIDTLSCELMKKIEL